MTKDETDLLHRHLNGDLDPAEQAGFFARVRGSAELRRALAAAALDDVLLSELAGEARARRPAPRRAWAASAAAAALMLLGLWFLLSSGRPPVLRLLDGVGVLRREGREMPLAAGLELREGDLLRGRATIRHGDAVGELDGQARLESAGLRLEQGRLLAKGPLPLGSVSLAGEAELTAGRELRLDVLSGSARVDGRDIAAGRFAVLGGEPRDARRIERARIDSALARAAAFLESRHRDLWTSSADGLRHGAAPSRSYAELGLLAYRRAGYPADHPRVGDLLGRLLSRPIESTYVAALQAMVLAEIDPVLHRERLRRCAELLAGAQARNGQWDYGLGSGAPDGDNSVSGYAALGLRACAAAGIPVERAALERARRWWISAQNADGGWGYHDAVNRRPAADPSRHTGDASYGSMSASALAALAAIDEILGASPASSAALRRGRDWLAAHFEAGLNPGKAPGFVRAHWYAACARAGLLLRTESFGGREWWPEIAEVLLSSQQPDGSWRLEEGDFLKPERNELLDTCLAVLFLTR